MENWNEVRLEAAPKLKAAPKPYQPGGWQEVKVIGRNLRGEVPDGPGDEVDGDGDGRVNDGTPLERPATPAEMEAGRLLREGVEAVAGAKKKKKASGLTPAQRAAQERNRAAAAAQQAEREAQQAAEEAEKQQEAAASEKRRLSALENDAEEIGKSAQKVRSEFRPLDEDENIRDLIDKDQVHVGLTFVDWTAREKTSDGELRQIAEIGVPEIRSMAGDISGEKPRVDEAGRKQTEDMVTTAVSESPLMRALTDRDGLPNVGIFDDLSLTAVQANMGADDDISNPISMAQTRSRLKKHLMGYHMPITGMVWINGNAADADPEPDAAATLQNPEVWNVSQTGPGVVRHETGHWAFAKSLASGGDRRAAADEFRDYYDRRVAPVAELRQKLAVAANPELAAKVPKGQVKAVVDRARHTSTLDDTAWLSPYGHSDVHEFFAETFALLSSPDPALRESVPEEVKQLVARILDMDLSDL